MTLCIYHLVVVNVTSSQFYFYLWIISQDTSLLLLLKVA